MVTYVIPEFKGENYFLSNFFANDQAFRGASGEFVTFPTAEHAFQAAKYKALDISSAKKTKYVLEVAKAKTPTEARRLGRAVKGLSLDAWDGMKVDVMREILLGKFNLDPLRSRLLATGDAMLVEGNTWGDKFWGRCDLKGYNILGVLLMEIRGYHRLHNGGWPETDRKD